MSDGVDTRAALANWVASMLVIGRARIEGFAERVVKDAAWELDNCDSVFEAAAKVRVLTAVTMLLDTSASVDDIRVRALKEALDGARFPRRSTSITSNLIHQLQAAAWGEVAEWLGGSK